MKFRKHFIELPLSIRHFDWSLYRRSGVQDIFSLDDYVETVVKRIDARNKMEEVESWYEEELIRELLGLVDHSLKIIKEAAYRDGEQFLKQSQRIKELELSLGLRRKPSPIKKKEPTKQDKDEIEKIAKLMK